MTPWQLGMLGNAAMYSNAHVWMQTFDCCCSVALQGCPAGCDQVHKLALLMQACLNALNQWLTVAPEGVTPTCYSCTKLEGAARLTCQPVVRRAAV